MMKHEEQELNHIIYPLVSCRDVKRAGLITGPDRPQSWPVTIFIGLKSSYGVKFKK